ncbi:hypothetical protein [Erythrobacter sp. THAF29]|uniref:hypothetical protein n=1 Tax=Erythrobacter sp. THAF29 TaxID=2587851 RepID=UPI001268C582|nr:hypothetical protein [Erythrobacter sp. THAF29]QFT78183.1 hypothetical protein FIU90_11595 [Erythrobacter sp. THAF29]
MRRSHIYLAAVAVATLGVVIAAPGTAQEGPPPAETPIDEVSPGTQAPALSPDQQAEYDGWPPDRKFAYDAWPAETQTYYWSLEPERQALFWRLADEDKIAITAMTGTEREAAWEIIEKNAAGSGDQTDEMPPPPGEG